MPEGNGTWWMIRLLKYHYLGDFDRDMIHLMRESGLYNFTSCRLLADNQPDQVLAFERGDYIFVFNFNPSVHLPIMASIQAPENSGLC